MAATSQRTLCTGAAGFIGSHLVRALLDIGLDHYIGAQKELDISREQALPPKE